MDTLLNVFLAIAVDNLTNAQEISEDEASEEKARLQHNKDIKQKYAPKPVPKYSSFLYFNLYILIYFSIQVQTLEC